MCLHAFLPFVAKLHPMLPDLALQHSANGVFGLMVALESETRDPSRHKKVLQYYEDPEGKGPLYEVLAEVVAEAVCASPCQKPFEWLVPYHHVQKPGTLETPKRFRPLGKLYLRAWISIQNREDQYDQLFRWNKIKAAREVRPQLKECFWMIELQRNLLRKGSCELNAVSPRALPVVGRMQLAYKYEPPQPRSDGRI